jgi:hypothetical protein
VIVLAEEIVLLLLDGARQPEHIDAVFTSLVQYVPNETRMRMYSYVIKKLRLVSDICVQVENEALMWWRVVEYCRLRGHSVLVDGTLATATVFWIRAVTE